MSAWPQSWPVGAGAFDLQPPAWGPSVKSLPFNALRPGRSVETGGGHQDEF